jgi:tRNA dimethylallyltransferase
MLAAGLVDEVRALRKRYQLTPGMPSMRAVGYRQVWQHLEGELHEREMREQALAATRQLAKRQLTWLRSFRGLEPAERLAHSFL